MQLNVESGASSSKSGGCSIFGILIGLLLIPAGFYMVYYGEMKLINHGQVFESVVMMAPERAAEVDGDVVKFKGVPEAEPIDVEYYDSPIIYYDRDIEEYQREEDSDGDVSYTWKTESSSSEFVPFTIDNISVEPGDAKVVGAREVFQGIKPTGSRTGGFDPNLVGSHDPEVGDRRLTLEIIDTGQELIVFGRKKGDAVAGGTTFVISALDDLSTAAELKAEYRLFYWLLKGGAVFAIAILMVLGPLTTLFGYVPLVGRGLNAAIGAVAFAFAIIAVLVVTLFLKLLWVLIALLILGLIVAVIMAVRSPKQPPPKAAMAQAPPQPTASAAEKDEPESAEDVRTPSIPRPVEGDEGPDDSGE